MARPRVLLVTQITELEWVITPLLEERADVASYDSPGVGDVPPVEHVDMDVLVAVGLAEVDRRGWDRCVIAGDEFASAIAIHMADARPDLVQGLALGHAAITFRGDGPDAAIDSSVLAAFMQLLDTDYRSWVRAYTQLTQGAYDDDLMDRFIERVRPDAARQLGSALGTLRDIESLEPMIRRLGVPLLLAEHRGCLVYRRESFREIREAFPDAHVMSSDEKPSCSPAFAEALRVFCEEIEAAHGGVSARG